MKLVVHDYHDGSGAKLTFESPDSFEEFASVIVQWRPETIAAAYKRVEEALSTVRG